MTNKQGLVPSFVIRAPRIDGQEIKIPLRMDFAWTVIEGIHTLGIENAVKFAHLMVYIDRRTVGLINGSQPPDNSPTLDDISRANMDAIINVLAAYTSTEPNTKRIDRLFHFINKAVHEGVMSWKEAAAFASRELQKPLSATALRLRVTRWANPKPGSES